MTKFVKKQLKIEEVVKTLKIVDNLTGRADLIVKDEDSLELLKRTVEGLVKNVGLTLVWIRSKSDENALKGFNEVKNLGKMIKYLVNILKIKSFGFDKTIVEGMIEVEELFSAMLFELVCDYGIDHRWFRGSDIYEKYTLSFEKFIDSNKGLIDIDDWTLDEALTGFINNCEKLKEDLKVIVGKLVDFFSKTRCKYKLKKGV